MKKKKGFTLIELLVVISIIAMLLAILMPALGKVKKLAQRLVCGTNVKGLGNAMYVYANDYDDDFPQQGGRGDNSWADSTPGWDNPNKDWSGDDSMTIASSLYLLVREADVGTKSFNCTSGDETEFEGPGGNKDLAELWDFGGKPWKWQSYAYQFPYAQNGVHYPVSGTSNSANAVLADRNPFLDDLQSVNSIDDAGADSYTDLVTDIALDGQGWRRDIGNAQSHDREGQNVLFVDGHVSFEDRPDCATRNDNIYAAFQGGGPSWTEEQRRIGAGSNKFQDVAGLKPKSSTDSLLANEVPEN